MLTNLRTELLEEKASIRIMRKQSKKWKKQVQAESGNNLVGMELDEVTLKTMGDSVKWLIKRFKELERPFLVDGSEGIMEDEKRRNRRSAGGRRRNSSVSPYYEHSAYAPAPRHDEDRNGEKNGRSRSRARHRRDDDEDNYINGDDNADIFWAQRIQYCDFTFAKRFLWLRRKAEAQSLYESLTRVQIRRTARQVGGMSYLMHEYGDKSCQAELRLRRIEERLGNILGVRRVN